MSHPALPHPLLRALFLIAGLVGPGIATAQQLPAPPNKAHASPGVPRFWSHSNRSAALSLPPALNQVAEVEPNDSSLIATHAVLGDTASGVIDPIGDADYFAIDLAAGTDLLLDVDANQYGSSLDPILVLIDRDGRTVLAYNDDADGLDSRLRYLVSATGRYYAAIVDYSGGGGPNYFYRLGIVDFVPPPPPTPGPGDPTTPFAQGLLLPLGITATASGGFFVANWGNGEVLRVTGSGIVSRFASVPTPADLVVDSYGDLLVAAEDSGVYRLTPAGVRSRFVTGFIAEAVTVDAGGDVWVGGFTTDPFVPEVRRYDARGNIKGTTNVAGMGGALELAFSPSGQLFATNGFNAVYRVTASGAQTVISSPSRPEGLAFDRDGYLYVSMGMPGEIHLYDPSFQEVGSIFARTNLSGPILLAFGRSTSGGMTSRLFATNAGYFDATSYPGAILEMNQSGIRAPGLPVGTTRPVVAIESVADAFLGDPGAITPEAADFLDRQGNDNGRLDVADFRVYLRLMNASAGTAGRVTP